MSDDQTLMDAMPANREFVLPEDRKMYRGFQMPAGMSTEQEMRYKSAIDEREDFSSKAARQLPRVSDDIRESIRGVGRSAKEAGQEMFKEAAPLPGMAKGVGEFAVDAALTVPRAKAAMYTDPEGSKEFMGAVASGDREAVRKFATGASESMVEPFATGGDAVLSLDALERGDSVEAGMYGAAVLAPYISLGMLKAAQRGGSKAAQDAAQKITNLEAGLDAGSINSIQAKEVGDAITAEYKAAEFAEQTRKSQQQSYDIIAKAREKAPGGKPPGGSDPEDLMMQRQQDYYEGITTDMRGTPGGKTPGGSDPELGFGASEVPGETAAREYYENQPRPKDADYRDPTDAELREMFEQQPHMFGRKTPGGGGGGPKSFNQIGEVDDSLFDIVGPSDVVRRLDPSMLSANQKARLMQRRDNIKQAKDQLFQQRREMGFPKQSTQSYEYNLNLEFNDELREIDKLLEKPTLAARKRNTATYGEREALSKNLLDRKIERSRLRSRRHEEDYNRVFGKDAPKGLRGPTDEQYAGMKDNFFAPVTQRRPTVEQMDELQAEARRLGLSSVDELLDLQDDFLKEIPYTYREKKALTPDQLDEIEGHARRLGLSDSDEYLELIKDFNRTSADPVKATKPVKRIDAQKTGRGIQDVSARMESDINVREEFGRDIYDYHYGDGELFKIGDRYVEARNLEDAERFLNRDGFEDYVSSQGLGKQGDTDAADLISKASPEESSKYFEMKRKIRPPVKMKFTLIDPYTDDYVRTKSGKIKEFNSPDDASEYADDVLNDMNLRIHDLDGNVPPGWR